mgnify:CR=1 FL=1|tara:strand:+ start:558 stop:1028 length:471 start_codon:yes stop_codon:yes gene_type:complete
MIITDNFNYLNKELVKKYTWISKNSLYKYLNSNLFVISKDNHERISYFVILLEVIAPIIFLFISTSILYLITYVIKFINTDISDLIKEITMVYIDKCIILYYIFLILFIFIIYGIYVKIKTFGKSIQDIFEELWSDSVEKILEELKILKDDVINFF